MTPNQLPPLPDGVTLEDLLIPLRVALETCHDSDWSLRQFKTPISHALAALAQQAQEPVAWLYVDTVGERYLCFSRPTGGGTITNLYTTPPAPQPAPVDERDAEIAELRAEVLAWRKQCDRLTHQVICCGVAASHPDATLTTRGAYAGKWNSGQAEEVRKLRAERDALAALQSPAPQTGRWLPIASAPRGSGENGPRSVNDPAYVQPPDLLLIHPEGISVGYYDWYYHPGYGVGASQYEPVWRSRPDGAGLDGVTHWMPLPAAPQTKGQP